MAALAAVDGLVATVAACVTPSPPSSSSAKAAERLAWTKSTSLAGFLGGWTDDLISRVVDTLLSFPAIVLAIGVTGALGIGLTNSMIAVGIVFSPQLARLVRGVIAP